MILSVNGDLQEDSSRSIAASDRGLTSGEGIFETCAILDGKIFAIDRHLARLTASAVALGMPAVDGAAVRKAAGSVLRAWVESQDGATGDGRLRITWTAGPGPLGVAPAPGPGTLVVAAGAIPAPSATATCHVSQWVRNERSPITGHKSTSYAENLLANRDAHARGADEAILANTRGDLSEGTTSNIFIETDGMILTPPLSSGCLPGITRDLVLAWGRRVGFDIEEVPMSIDVMSTTEHAAISSSLRGLVPVSAIDGRTLEVGPITRKLCEIVNHRRRVQPNP